MLRSFTLLLLAAMACLAGTAQAQTLFTGKQVFGLTDEDSLVSWHTLAPDQVDFVRAIEGIDPHYHIVGMDVRPQTGKLYVLAYNTNTGGGRLFTLAVDSLSVQAVEVTTSDMPLELGFGNGVGFDFNPVENYARVMARNGKSYRIDAEQGLLLGTDSLPAYGSGDANEGEVPAIGAVAYSNSGRGVHSTIMYAYDDDLDNLVSMAAPSHVLASLGSPDTAFSTGSGGIDLDIAYNEGDSSNTAYAVGSRGGRPSVFYQVDLEAAAYNRVGQVGRGFILKDIAIAISVLRDTAIVIVDTTHADTTMTAAARLRQPVQARVAPNPVTASSSLCLAMPGAAAVSVQVFDLAGSLVYQTEARLPAGDARLPLALQSLTPGLYQCRVSSQGRTLAALRVVR